MSSLDWEKPAQVRNFFQQLAGFRGHQVVTITHMDFNAAEFESVYVMEHGSLAAGSPRNCSAITNCPESGITTTADGHSGVAG